MALSKKPNFFGILILTSKYRWLTDLISTVNFRFSSITSARPKPVILLIIKASCLISSVHLSIRLAIPVCIDTLLYTKMKGSSNILDFFPVNN